MARKYFVRRSPQKRKSSAVPLIFEKAIWGLIGIVLLILVLSLFWRHNEKDRAQDVYELQNKIIRQIPRAQLEFAEQQVTSRQDQQALVVSLTPPEQSDRTQPTAAPDATPNVPEPPVAAVSGEDRSVGTTEPAPLESGVQPEPRDPSPQRLDSHIAPRDSSDRPGPDQGGASPDTQPRIAGQAPYIIRVGAFKTKANVAVICARIEKLGYTTQVWELNHARLGHLYMVDLAPFEKREDAMTAKADVEKHERLKTQLIIKQ